MIRTRVLFALLLVAGACSSSTEPMKASDFVPCAIGYKKATVDGVLQCVPM